MTSMDELNKKLADATAQAAQTLSRIQTAGAANQATLDAALRTATKAGEIAHASGQQTTAMLNQLLHRTSFVAHIPIIGAAIDHSLQEKVVTATAHYEEVRSRHT